MSNEENYFAKKEYHKECLEVVLSNKELFDDVLDVAFAEEDLSYWLNDYVDIDKYVSFDQALGILEQTDEWWLKAEREIYDPVSIAELITLDNVNAIAHILAMSGNFKIGEALFNELKYYKEIGRI